MSWWRYELYSNHDGDYDDHDHDDHLLCQPAKIFVRIWSNRSDLLYSAQLIIWYEYCHNHLFDWDRGIGIASWSLWVFFLTHTSLSFKAIKLPFWYVLGFFVERSTWSFIFKAIIMAIASLAILISKPIVRLPSLPLKQLSGYYIGIFKSKVLPSLISTATIRGYHFDISSKCLPFWSYQTPTESLVAAEEASHGCPSWCQCHLLYGICLVSVPSVTYVDFV